MSRRSLVVVAALLAGCHVRPLETQPRPPVTAGPPGSPPAAVAPAATAYQATVCDKPSDDTARTESWSKHFAAYEELPSGESIQLSDRQQFIDSHSAIVIKRISDTPVIRATNGQRDAITDAAYPDGFDVDVVVLRRYEGRTCRLLVRVPGLQTTGGYDDATHEPDGCPANLQVFTDPQVIEKNATWRIPAGTFRHGDSIEVQMYGRFVGEESFNKKLDGKVKVKMVVDGTEKEVEKEAFYSATRSICGQAWTANVSAIDFGSVSPWQEWFGAHRRLDEYNGRADTRFPIYFDFPTDEAASLDSGLYDQVLKISATALGQDGKVRELALRKDTSRPTLESPHDGDTVIVKVTRKYNPGTGAAEFTSRTYTFSAVTGGLHAAASGDTKASFGISPAFLAVLRHDGGTPIFGFAETFSYTATRRTIYPGFFDSFGFGVHVSLLARPKAESGDDNDDHPLSLGLGGHATFGANSIQLGAGWDLLNEKAYVLLGVSVSDLAAFINKK